MFRSLCDCLRPLTRPSAATQQQQQQTSTSGDQPTTVTPQGGPVLPAGTGSSSPVQAYSGDGGSRTEHTGKAAVGPSDNSSSPAHAELDQLHNSILQVLELDPDKQCGELVKLDVLKQFDVVLNALDNYKPSKVVERAADTIKSWDAAVTGADKFFTALAKTNSLGKNWSGLGAAGQQVATAMSGAAYVGPVFALVGFALKQWSMAAKVPVDAAMILRSCRDLLADVLTAWPGLACNPEAKQRMEAAVKETAKLINDTIVIHKGSLICRFFLAQIQKDDLTKAAEKLQGKRASLMTLLLLNVQPAPVVRRPLAGGKVFGFQQQEAELAAQLLLPGSQVLWLRGMGGSGKSTMACQLFNRVLFGVPEANLSGFDRSAFLDLEGRKTHDQLQPLLVEVLRQLRATGFGDSQPAAELATILVQLAERQRILLVLDNVWTDEQIDLLLPTKLHTGSRVIVTTRVNFMCNSAAWQELKRRQLLLGAQMHPLGEAAAQQLFTYRTNMASETLPVGLQQLQAAIIDACDGLPIALRIAGGLLHETTDKAEWQETLKLLLEGASIPNTDTDYQLRGVVTKSYNNLNPVAQSMFLDVVSVMHGTNWCDETLALEMWDSWHHSGVHLAWKELQRCSLVTVDAAEIHVHDIIKAFGRAIIKNDPVVFGSRAWVRYDGELEQFDQEPMPAELKPLVAASLEYAADGPTAWTQMMDRGAATIRLLVASWCGLWAPVRPLQQLSTLTCLRLLDVSHNDVSGQLSEQWSALTNLRVLELSYNKLSGQLPKQWATLTNVKVLSLSNNSQLSGPLPEQWSALTKLEQLDLSDNFLSGQLPEQWAALTNLQQLDLSNNELSGQLLKQWSVVSALTNLQQLDLSYNSLSGQLPKQWSALNNLCRLNLSYNKLSRGLLTQWSALTKLEQLGLSHNQLSGQLPEQWSALTNLEQLDLSKNQLSGALPGQWLALTNLQGLYLSDNQLSWLLPKQWPADTSALTNLRWLDMSNNQLSGQLPEQWSALTNLWQLQLSSNQLSGRLPEQWSALTNLRGLALSNNQLSRLLPEQWSALTNLNELDMSNNQLSGPLPEQWSALTNLEQLDLSGNQLLGALPSQWTALTNLQWLDISSNQLSGQLPEQWSALTNLRGLALSNNQLSGLLPEQWSALTNLTGLHLSVNQLSGRLPEQWSALTNLEQLHMYNNQLSGFLPEEWSALVDLRELVLFNNQLFGLVPEQWSVLTYLQLLQDGL